MQKFSETGTSSYFTREEERMKVYKKLMNALAAVEKVVLVSYNTADPRAHCGKCVFP